MKNYLLIFILFCPALAANEQEESFPARASQPWFPDDASASSDQSIQYAPPAHLIPDELKQYLASSKAQASQSSNQDVKEQSEPSGPNSKGQILSSRQNRSEGQNIKQQIPLPPQHLKEQVEEQAAQIVARALEYAPKKWEVVLYKILSDKRVQTALKWGLPISILFSSYQIAAPDGVKEYVENIIGDINQLLANFYQWSKDQGEDWGSYIGTGAGDLVYNAGSFLSEIMPRVGKWIGSSVGATAGAIGIAGGVSALGGAAAGAYKGANYFIDKVKEGANYAKGKVVSGSAYAMDKLKEHWDEGTTKIKNFLLY